MTPPYKDMTSPYKDIFTVLNVFSCMLKFTFFIESVLSYGRGYVISEGISIEGAVNSRYLELSRDQQICSRHR